MVDLIQRAPRDDRAWPRGAFAISVLIVLACLVTMTAIVAAARDRGGGTVLVVLACFLVASAVTCYAYAAGIRAWLRGEQYPPRMQLVFASVAILGVGLLFADGHVGGAVLSGLGVGMLSANAWGIREGRANRDLVDEAEAAAARQPPEPPREAETPEPRVREHVPLGRLLAGRVALERRRSIAWLLAGVVATVAFGVAGAPSVALGCVVLAAAVSVLWVARRLLGSWLALRDFVRAAHPPRRAFVVLLNDPAPKMIRPLLAVWSQAPAVSGGRIPRPEAVFRADEEAADLLCFQGSVTVHEAWVDTGPRSWSKPRWVAADEGVALPHRRALFGRWYVGALIGGERPDPPTPLSLPEPRPEPDAPGAEPGDSGRWVTMLGGRLLGLGLIGLLLWWLL